MSGEPQAIFSETYGRGNREREGGHGGHLVVVQARARFADYGGAETQEEESFVNVSARERRPGLGRQAV